MDASPSQSARDTQPDTPRRSTSALFEKIRVVLCRPQIAGNVGAIARAMLNFGPHTMVLVDPGADHLSHEARRRSRSAEFILEQAPTVSTLAEALTGCTVALGTTARFRTTDRIPLRPRQATQKLLEPIGRGEQVALVFGHETTGMTNLELDQCRIITTIPTCAELPSLNLSMAASILLFELHQVVIDALDTGAWPPAARDAVTPDPPAPHEQLEDMYGQLQHCLEVGKFLNPQNPDITMRYLRRFFSHSAISEFEVRLWRAILRRLANTIETPKPRWADRDEWIAFQKTMRASDVSPTRDPS